MAELTLEVLKERLPATIPEAGSPGVPYEVLPKEAQQLLVLLENDAIRRRLIDVGMDSQEPAKLSGALEVFVAAQGLRGNYAAIGVTPVELKAMVDRLEALWAEAYPVARFYFEDPEAQVLLDQLDRKGGTDDLIQDLRQLVHIMRPRMDLVKDPEFQAGWLDEAIEVADKVQRAQAEVHVGRKIDGLGTVVMRLRNRAVTKLLESMDAVRRYGRFAYRKDPDTRLRFGSEYQRLAARRARARAAAQ